MSHKPEAHPEYVPIMVAIIAAVTGAIKTLYDRRNSRQDKREEERRAAAGVERADLVERRKELDEALEFQTNMLRTMTLDYRDEIVRLLARVQTLETENEEKEKENEEMKRQFRECLTSIEELRAELRALRKGDT